jgi:MIP family channel proteins
MEKHLRPALVETIGTFALVFIGAASVCVSGMAPPNDLVNPGVLGIALAQGFILAAALTATVPASGGFLNPAVTLTLWVFRRLEGRRAVWLIGAQIVGAVLAGLCVRLMFAEDVLRLVRCGTPHLNARAFGSTALPSVFSGIGIELVLTFLLTFAIFGTILDPRAPRLGGLGAGLALAAIVLVGYSLTGGAANPVRWFGPAVAELSIPGMESDAFRDHTVYWLGPIAGALLAGALYDFLILRTAAETETEPDEHGASGKAEHITPKTSRRVL